MSGRASQTVGFTCGEEYRLRRVGQGTFPAMYTIFEQPNSDDSLISNDDESVDKASGKASCSFHRTVNRGGSRNTSQILVELEKAEPEQVPRTVGQKLADVTVSTENDAGLRNDKNTVNFDLVTKRLGKKSRTATKLSKTIVSLWREIVGVEENKADEDDENIFEKQELKLSEIELESTFGDPIENLEQVIERGSCLGPGREIAFKLNPPADINVGEITVTVKNDAGKISVNLANTSGNTNYAVKLTHEGEKPRVGSFAWCVWKAAGLSD